MLCAVHPTPVLVFLRRSLLMSQANAPVGRMAESQEWRGDHGLTSEVHITATSSDTPARLLP